jgi:hypothetical protein
MSEHLVQVRERSIEAVHEGDIKALYELVEEFHGELTDEMEQGLYGNILELALELLTNALENGSALSLENPQEYFTLRALYEYAISHYSAKRFNDAKALFEVLVGIAQEEAFVQSMHIHAVAAAKEIEIDYFIDEFCEVSRKLDDFYITTFAPSAQELLEEAKALKENA